MLSAAMVISALSGLGSGIKRAEALEAGTLLINEVCTGNEGENNNLVDVVDSKGKYADWIELYNPGDEAVALGGLFVTDDSAVLDKAALPDDAVVPAGGYYVVYCGKNIVKDDYPDKAVALFGLSADGETLTLSDGENIVDVVEVPSLAKDETYARIPSAGEDFAVCTPSAGEANSADYKVVHPVAAPVFSRDSGTFVVAFTLSITAEDGADIYYTTDGSIPDTSSQKYTKSFYVTNRTDEANDLSAVKRNLLTDRYWSGATSPTVKVDKGTVIRAIAVKGGVSSPVSTASYFVGIRNSTYSNVPIISIVTDRDNLFDDDIGIYLLKNCQQRGSDWERACHIDYIENEQVVFSQDCGLRIQGGYSRTDYQKSFRLYAREAYGDSKFRYPFFGELESRDGEGRAVDEFETIVLRNGGNDANYCKFKDALLQSMVQDMNYATQASRPVIAFINGEYWGIYTMQEDYSDAYVKDHYDIKKKNVVMIKPDSMNNNVPKVEEGNDSDLELWTATDEWVRQADLTDEAQYGVFEEMFDTESLAEYFAFETYITNEDWAGKNWCVYRSREADEGNPDYSDCKWRFMVYDVEMGAYLWSNPGESPVNNKLMQMYYSGKDNKDTVAVILYKAFQNPEFRRLYLEALEKTAEHMSSENYQTKLEEYKAQYMDNLTKYFQRFPTGASVNDANTCIGWMNDFFIGKSSLRSREEYMPIMAASLEALTRYETLKKNGLEMDSTSTNAYNDVVNKSKRTTKNNYDATQLENSINTLEAALDALNPEIGDTGLEAYTLFTQKTEVTDGKYAQRWLMIVPESYAATLSDAEFTVRNVTDKNWADDGIRVRATTCCYTSVSAAGETMTMPDGYVVLAYAIKNIPENIELRASLENHK